MAETKETVETVETKEAVTDDTNTIQLKNALPDGATSVTFDWDKITGYELIKCYTRAKAKDAMMTVSALSMPYQAAVAAIASGVKYDDILGMKAQDFNAVVLKVQNFLLSTES